MVRVSIDDQAPQFKTDTFKTVGEVLETIFSGLPQSRMVTDIVLDGRQVLKSENVSFLQQGLEEVKELQVRTTDREIWAANGYDIALSCVERVQKSLIRAAELFREEKRAEANQFFVHCLEGLERFLEAIVITRCALKLNFKEMVVDGISLFQMEENLSLILKGILLQQEQQDFIGVADKVEYELLTNLYTWGKALHQLRASQTSNA